MLTPSDLEAIEAIVRRVVRHEINLEGRKLIATLKDIEAILAAEGTDFSALSTAVSNAVAAIATLQAGTIPQADVDALTAADNGLKALAAQLNAADAPATPPGP